MEVVKRYLSVLKTPPWMMHEQCTITVLGSNGCTGVPHGTIDLLVGTEEEVSKKILLLKYYYNIVLFLSRNILSLQTEWLLCVITNAWKLKRPSQGKLPI